MYCGNAEVDRVKCDVSDFYADPIFNERTFVIGQTYQMIDGKIEKQKFSSKIFLYEIMLDCKEIDSIILPNRRNIHVFSIVLTY